MHESSFERYLDEVEHGLGRRGRVEQRLLRELRGHLRQRFDELRGEGVDTQSALDTLIIEFGEPQELIREYQRDHTRSKRIMRTLTATFTAAAAVLAWFFLMPIQPAPQTASTGVPAAHAAAGPIAPLLASMQGATHWMRSALPFTVTAGANGVPAQVNHQGVVTVNGQRYTGTGYFRFALVDPDSSTNVWTNDGSNVGGAGSPADAVSLSVSDGLYAVQLGDTSLPNMVALGSSLFNDDNLKLRVWFDDGNNGPQQLSPDHAMTSSPYAFMAASVADGAITNAKLGNDLDGWITAGETWSYTSSDAPSFVMAVAGNKTAKYSAGMRVRLTQTSIKYFIVTAVAYSAPNTLITLYGGTDYDLLNAPIAAPYFSTQKTPQGFPASPEKWTERVIHLGGSFLKLNNATANTWYNVVGSLDVPIGTWRINYNFCGGVRSAIAGGQTVYFTLSTTTNSETNTDFTSGYHAVLPSVAQHEWRMVSKTFPLSVNSKTTYYLLINCDQNTQYLGYWCSGRVPVVIEATCAYL